jgi:hypothetical protein
MDRTLGGPLDKNLPIQAAVVNVMVKRRGMTASGMNERDERK